TRGVASGGGRSSPGGRGRRRCGRPAGDRRAASGVVHCALAAGWWGRGRRPGPVSPPTSLLAAALDGRRGAAFSGGRESPMRIEVFGKGIEVTQAILEHAESKASKLPRYF